MRRRFPGRKPDFGDVLAVRVVSRADGLWLVQIRVGEPSWPS